MTEQAHHPRGTTERFGWCEGCDVRVTFENARQHPNGLGGHSVTWYDRSEEAMSLDDGLAFEGHTP